MYECVGNMALKILKDPKDFSWGYLFKKKTLCARLRFAEELNQKL